MYIANISIILLGTIRKRAGFSWHYLQLPNKCIVFCFDLLVLWVVEFISYTSFEKVINIIQFGAYWECFNGGLLIEMKLQKKLVR